MSEINTNTDLIKLGVNSYCSMEFAETYISANFFLGSDWLSLNTLQKSQLLITACQHLDNNAFKGKKLSDNQHLAFPRVFTGLDYYDDYIVNDYYGYYLDPLEGYEQYNGKIPDDVKKAQCEMALFFLEQNPNLKLIRLKNAGFDDITIGSLKFSGSRNQEKKFPTKVYDLISIFLSGDTTTWERS